MVRIGIDLAIKEIGFVFIDDNDKTIVFTKKSLKGSFYDETTILEIRKQIREFKELGLLDENLEVAIEIGNFGSSAMTQKFAFLAGIYASEFEKAFPCEFNFVNPQSWWCNFCDRSFGKFKKNMVRQQRKEIVLEFVKYRVIDYQHYFGYEVYIENEPYEPSKLTSDMSDAFMIAQYGWTAKNCFIAKKDLKKKEKILCKKNK